MGRGEGCPELQQFGFSRTIVRRVTGEGVEGVRGWGGAPGVKLGELLL